MSRENTIKNLRIEKIGKLKELGMEVYVDPKSVKQDLTLKEVNVGFADLQKSGEVKSLVGRIMIKRGAGKIAFTKIFDGTDEFQVVLKVDELGVDKMKLFDKLFDMGDFAEFSGIFFTTEKGQESLLVKDFRMLTKSLLPLPEKWHGLQDVEEKYRKRYLDLISDKDAYSRFITRSKIISEIRRILDGEGFLEVETPILQNSASGAMAETFNTHHNDYGIDMVLRIALEAEHKMIMAGGYPAVYEIGKIFRNEGSDSTHMQEFTMIEWYRAYKGLDYNMELTEKILKSIAKNVVGKMKYGVENSEGEIIEIDFEKKWQRVEFNDLIREYAGVDPEKASREELEEKAIELGDDSKEVKKLLLGNLLDSIYKKTVRKNIKNPTYVMHYPGSVKPLAIQNENGTAEVAQLVIAGSEITNQYAELVDPVKQRKLLEEQTSAKEAGDTEAMDINENFLEAMEHGMPPMTGIGYGIDRLVGIFTEQNNLRDTVFFPIVKPKKQSLNKKEAEELYRKKKVVVIADESVGYGVTSNALTQLGISIGGFSSDKSKFGVEVLIDKDGILHRPDCFYGMVNFAGDQKVMVEFIQKCIEAKIEFFDFSNIMRKAHTDEQMQKGYKEKNTSDIGYIAVGAIVPNDFEKEFLSGLKLFGT